MAVSFQTSWEKVFQAVSTAVDWYNYLHRHSAIRFVTPAQRHAGDDITILAQRQATYEAAKARNPHRWAKNTRNWEPVTQVLLNPDKTVPQSEVNINA